MHGKNWERYLRKLGEGDSGWHIEVGSAQLSLEVNCHDQNLTIGLPPLSIDEQIVGGGGFTMFLKRHHPGKKSIQIAPQQRRE